MLAKVIVVLILLVIVYTLGSSFVFMVRDKGEGKRASKRLTWRIGLSLSLFLVLFVMFLLGWIVPSRGPVNFGG